MAERTVRCWWRGVCNLCRRMRSSKGDRQGRATRFDIFDQRSCSHMNDFICRAFPFLYTFHLSYSSPLVPRCEQPLPRPRYTIRIMAFRCRILDLPVELRLLIYHFVLLENPVITIGTAALKGAHQDIVHRLYSSGRSPYPAIPEYHEPIVDIGYHSGLLSFTNPAVIPVTPSTCHPPDDPCEAPFTAHMALRLVSRQIREELTRHFKMHNSRNTSVFVQYPHGLHVFKTMTPHLLRQARSIHLAGVHVSRTYCPTRAACMGYRQLPPELDMKYNGNVRPDSSGQLADLMKSTFGPDSTHKIEKIELRIYYPGDDSYSTVWGDDSSPIVVALQNIHCAEVGIEVWRGRQGTGVYLTAKRINDKRRVISTVWRRLHEGWRGEPACGSWVLDPKWPQWEEDYEMSDGPKGDLIISG